MDPVPSQDATRGVAQTPKPRSSLDTALVLACAVLPYLGTLRFEFAYDDDTQVLQNPAITSWRYVVAYFTQPVAGFFEGVTSAHYYRPLFFLWLRLDYFLWGRHAAGWHAANIILHAAASILAFAVLRRYFSDRRWAAIGAMLFAVHPAHAETVAWVSGCTDSLLAVSVFGCLLLWMRSRTSNSAALRAASLLLCATALLTKETAIILPVLIFAHAWCNIPSAPDRRSKHFLGALRDAAPYALVAVAYFAVRHTILGGLPATPMWVWPSHALLTIPSLVLFYVRHLLWPFNLGLYYDIPIVAGIGSSQFWIPVLVILLLGAAGVSVFSRTRDARIILATLWFLLPLAPVLYVGVFQRDDFAHDRYLYLPVLSLSIALGLCCEFAERLRATRKIPLLPIYASRAVIILFGIMAYVEARPWQNNLTLYANAVRISPKHSLARNNLAREFAQIEHFDEAAAILEGLLRDRPDLWLANFNYGFVNYRLGRLPAAEEYLGRAIQIDPKEADEHLYLGATYLKQGRLASAEQQLHAAIDRKPHGKAYHYTLAIIYWQQGRLAAARDEMESELKTYPGNAAIQGQLEALNRQIAGGTR